MRSLAAAVAAVMCASASNAAIVYDNGAPNGVSGYEATQYVEAEDFTPGTAATITGAGVYLHGEGNLDNWDGHLRWYIFDNAGGEPGTLLQTGLVNPAPIDTGIDVMFTGSGHVYLLEFDLGQAFAAAAGTTYWFGIHAAADEYFTFNGIFWSTTDSNDSFAYHESEGGTFDNWGSDGAHLAFYLTGEPVPEPATWTMMIGGFGLVGLVARRRRCVRAT
ncbi:MAG: PEPxxWA-CTERM sorting domain-containing protein [Sphingomonadaceae bacterium]